VLVPQLGTSQILVELVMSILFLTFIFHVLMRCLVIVHADRTALSLIQFILDDPEERATKASCFRAYKQYESEREELVRVTAKLVKTKNQRNAMIDPLKRMTAELQKIKQERRLAPKDKSLEVENEQAALLAKYVKSQQALDSAMEAKCGRRRKGAPSQR
jgi:uncharacterized protein YhaN